MLEIIMNEVVSNALNYIHYYKDDNATMGDIDLWLSLYYSDEVIAYLRKNNFYSKISNGLVK